MSLPAPPTDNHDFNSFVWAIGQQESGGEPHPYATPPNSANAMGKYQITAENVRDWSQEVLGHSITPQQFLASPALQEQIARTKLWEFYSRYGAAGAAAVWYSGRPNPNATYGDPPVYKYVREVLALMKKFTSDSSIGSGAGTGSAGAGGGAQNAIFGIPSEITDFFSEALKLFSAFFKPSTYVRIGAGVFGIILLIFGIYVLGREAFRG